MTGDKAYESYPAWIPALTIFLTLLIYALGAYILAWLHVVLAIFYLLYCLGVEIAVLRRSCVNCYYYGKLCGFGRGRLSALLFRRGESRIFADKEISWYHIVPDFMVLVFPVVGGIVTLVLDFSWVYFGALLILLILFFCGNAFVRGRLTCRHCKQREIGCPAAKHFSGG